YQEKRDFARTPEPTPRKPRSGKSGTLSFVVHRHEARRLHYDLRLEMEGVLKSWAVPRGFSYDPKEKRLAVRTEDHPIEYIKFDGVIPQGEYGAGTMTIWDAGHYIARPKRDILADLAGGDLKIILYGRRLRGEWHLVRTSKDEKEWLLFKHRDLYARDKEDPVFNLDLSGQKPAAFPRRFQPMRAQEQTAPFSDPGWLFEMQFQGVRISGAKKGERVQLRDPKGTDHAKHFPELVAELQKLRAENAILDGVVVALDDKNRPCPEKLALRMEGKDSPPVFYYVFDLLYFDQWDLRDFPLVQRKEALRSLLPCLSSVLYVDDVRSEGEGLAKVMAEAGLPAVVAKVADSPYTPGASSSWKSIPVQTRRGSQKRDLLNALSPGDTPSQPRVSRFRFSNLDKIYWPKEPYTKGDLLAYYNIAAEVLLPYLVDRPLHMHRFPDGIEGKSFYQKDATHQLPKWIDTVTIASGSGKSIRYIVCSDRETLLYLINLGSIDIHPWSSRRASLDSPDWAIIDLDPNQSPFEHVVKVARVVGKILRGIGLRPYLKTSGKTGLHVFVPLLKGYTYDQVRMFSEGVARTVVSQLRDIATVERNPKKRGRRVYVDFLQNRSGQTVVPAYSVRPVPGAQVSTPLDWDELMSGASPGQFTIATLPARLERMGDLFRPVLEDRQDLLPAIEALQDSFG
ncbi:MAG: non-homologous end-joining DNA ligase, partial [Planctomycetota bacterium]